MVLKFKDYSMGDESGAWTFIDATQVSVFYDKTLETNFVRVVCDNDKNSCDIPIHEIAYILNENGKTIDTVRGFKKEAPSLKSK